MCTYNFQLPVDPTALLQMFRQEIVDNGGVVTGELPNVNVSMPTQLGRVEGECRLVNEATVNIKITKKPPTVSCNMVRDTLVSYLTEAVKTYSAKKNAA
ncbi:MAG: hypothetical protein U0641_03755 [Anaerolineae bacterium]